MTRDQTKILTLLSDGSAHALEDIVEALTGKTYEAENDFEQYATKRFAASDRICAEIQELKDAGLVKAEFVKAEDGFMLTKR